MCDIEGRAGRGIVDDARRINCCMEHRGGIGSEPNTGDGAGILTALPHKLLARFARTAFARTLPEPGRYGVGNVFLPHDPAERRACKERIEGDRQRRRARNALAGARCRTTPSGPHALRQLN